MLPIGFSSNFLLPSLRKNSTQYFKYVDGSSNLNPHEKEKMVFYGNT